MNNDYIRSIKERTAKDYNINLVGYSNISDKSYKVLSNNNEKFLIKKTKNKVKDKYLFLQNEGVNNIIYPIKNVENSFSTRLSNELYRDDCYCVLPFYENNHALNETKAKALLEELKYLHKKTMFSRNLSINRSKQKVGAIIEYLNYKFSLIEAYVRTIEASTFDEFSIPILKNYQYILDSKKILIDYNKKIIKSIKEEKSVYFCFLHNNPKLDHLIINEGNKYLISIDNGVIGIPSLDIAKYYVENKDINFDIAAAVKEYFKNYDDEFYYDYFIYLVNLFYIKGLIVDKKGYISTQSFIYTSESIKNFIKTFELTTK